MKRLLITFTFIFACSLSRGQNVAIIEENADFAITEKQTEFYYIEKEFSLSNDGWLATYVFGDLTHSDTNKGRNIKFNTEKITIYPLEYYSYQIPIDKEASVSIGGIFGTKYVLKGKEGRLPVYLSLGGFRAAPSVQMGGVGVSFSTGSIYPLDMNLGQFLVEILGNE
ncbi:MAG: hypothetical protein LBO74_03850 [Candidatus Symbiothrix sp.]|jgi:hypothetical protein|nr:hypothetical protein [Candidatus Symbiothrix sp.]